MLKETQKVFNLYGGGTIEFGYAPCGHGQLVRTAKLMARVQIPIESWGKSVPDGWFIIGGERSLSSLLWHFKENELNFLPDWLRADLFEHFYYQLLSQHP